MNWKQWAEDIFYLGFYLRYEKDVNSCARRWGLVRQW